MPKKVQAEGVLGCKSYVSCANLLCTIMPGWAGVDWESAALNSRRRPGEATDPAEEARRRTGSGGEATHHDEAKQHKDLKARYSSYSVHMR